MSATFSNELAVHMFLEERENNSGEDNQSQEVQHRPAVKLARAKQHGSLTSFRGSFSEVIAREEQHKQVDEKERMMFDALFPEIIETKEKKTFFQNPIHDDDANAPDEAYVIRDPEDDQDSRPRKTFSVRMSSLVNKVNKLLAETSASESETMLRRSFSMRRDASSATPSNSRKSSRSMSLGGMRLKKKESNTSETTTSNRTEGSSPSEDVEHLNGLRKSMRFLKRLVGQDAASQPKEDTERAKSVRMSFKIKKMLFNNSN